VRILALLPDDGLRRLARTVPSGISIERVDLDAYSRGSAAASHVLVVDPTLLREEALIRVLTRADSAGTRVTLYCELTTMSLQRIFLVTQLFPINVVFFGASGECALVDRFLVACEEAPAAARALHKISARLAKKSDVVSRAVVWMYSSPPAAAEDLKDRAAPLMTRPCRRELTNAGLVSGRIMLSAARAAHAIDFLKYSRREVADIARVVGYDSDRSLLASCQRILGLAPTRAVRELSVAACAEKLHLALLQPSQG
jgi:AraC-like DNA-binding protein